MNIGDLRLDCRTSVPAETPFPGARERGDRPGGIDLADPGLIGNVDIPGSVHRHIEGAGELRLDCRASVPAETPLPGARERGDRPGGIDLADLVADDGVDIPGTVHRYIFETGDFEHGGDRPGRAIELVDPLGRVSSGSDIGNVEVSGTVQCQIPDLAVRERRRQLECVGSIAGLRLRFSHCDQ